MEHDIIIAINRQPIASVDDIRKVQGNLKPGDAVAFRVVRPIPGARTKGAPAAHRDHVSKRNFAAELER